MKAGNASESEDLPLARAQRGPSEPSAGKRFPPNAGIPGPVSTTPGRRSHHAPHHGRARAPCDMLTARRSLALVAGFTIATAVERHASADGDRPIEVVSRGEDASPPPKDTSVAGSVIREERLQSPGLRASDVLRTQPGVAISESGGYGELSTASIRGATATQTPVYLAGIRLNDDVGGTADLSTVPLFLLQRIEIYRSNAPLEADTLGIGGAIFFEPRIPRKTEAGSGVMGGSFKTEALWGYAGAGDDRGAVLAGIRFDGSANDYSFVDDRGTRFDATDDRSVVRSNSDVRSVDAWALGRLRLGRGHADLVVGDLEREQGTPGLRIFPSTRARVVSHRRLGAISTQVPCGTDDRCTLAASTSVLASGSNYDDPLHELSYGAASTSVDAVRTTDSVRLKLWPSERLRVSPAVTASIESLGMDVGSEPSLRARRITSRGAVSASWFAMDAVALHGMTSAECNGTTAGGRVPWTFPPNVTSPSEGAVCGTVDPSARFGVEIGPPSVTVLANVGRYVRVPTLSELYGVSASVRGNGELRSEHGVTFDVGLRARRGRDNGPFSSAFIDVFGFVRNADDLVTYAFSQLGFVVPFNVGSARVIGAEVLAGLRPLPFAQLELAGTVLDPRDTSPGHLPNDVLPYQSRLRLVPRLELEARPGSRAFERVKTSLTYIYESNRKADRAGTVIVPEQGSLDLEVEVATLEHLTVRARGANLLDQTRVDLVGYPLPGRALYVALEARW